MQLTNKETSTACMYMYFKCNYKYMCIVTIVTLFNDDIINILTMKSLIKFNLQNE